jgi:two-component system sensor histidine kinase KdpD
MSDRQTLREYAEAVGLIAALTAAGWIWPISYRAFSNLYLLAIVVLSLRMGRGPVLLAAIASVVVLDYFIIPPRLSFQILGVDDITLYVTFIVVALVVSHLTYRIRLQGAHIGAARERESLLAESGRLHQSLFDSVSHELKTPLTVLRSAAPALSKMATGEQASLAAEICQATDRLDRLVENLLDQTRLESGILTPQLDWCDARDLILAACAAVKGLLAGRAVNTEIAENMTLLRVDAPLMEQAIGNLLMNAALHTPAGTPITIRAGVDRGRNQAYISVADKGPGIPRELRDRLFQKFQRGRDANAGGLGLGLSIVHGFVAAQGGEVAVDNHPDGGAVFTIYLPIAPCETVPND